MSDGPDLTGVPRAVGEDADAGTPIAELTDLGESPSPRFVSKVLDGVNRRQTAGRMLELAWWGWTSLVLEMVRALFGALGAREDSRRKD